MHIQYSLRYWSGSSWTIAQVMKHFPSTSFEQVTRYPTPRYFCVVRFQVSMREVQKMTSFRCFFFFIFSYSKDESFNYADFGDEISTLIPYYFLLREAPCLPDKLLQVLDVVNGFTRIGFSRNYPFVSVAIEPKICIMAKKIQSKPKVSLKII